MMRVEALHKAYDAPLLRGLNLSVEAGENVFLLGPSGAGKSTLLRCIAGLEQLDSGSVWLDSNNVTQTPTHRRSIGMMFQEPALFPHLNALQNVCFGLRYHDIPRAAWPSEGRKWLARVGMEDRAESAVDTLSGGQKQRIALARTLAARPQAVLLDEPLSALDGQARDQLGMATAQLLHEANVPALWVTHDEGEAARLGNRVLRLRDGQAYAGE